MFGCGFLLGRAALAREPLAPGDGAPVSVFSQEGSSQTEDLPPEFPSSQAASGWAPLGQEPDSTAISAGDWNLILVNQESPLPEDFSTPDLTQLRNGHAIDSRAYPALQSMMDAAREEGLRPLICSSYRTWENQKELFDNKVQRLLAEGYSQTEAGEYAAMWVARPGSSEHQTGLAVDIVDTSYQLLDEAQ